ncbi:MAG: hypothetical protein LBB48_03935 [Treponema sp.]|nr:hypothetical protein [Treponema sp.]
MTPVPASFQDFFTDTASREYTGNVWYERESFVPAEWRNCNVFIRLGSVTRQRTVFVNGAEITRREGGFFPFAADITQAATYGGANRLVVLVSNELSETTRPAGRTAVMGNGGKK